MLKRLAKFLFFIVMVLWIENVYPMSLDMIKQDLLVGDYKAASIEGERLLADNVRSPELSYLLGLAYLKNGNYSRAVEIFENIIKDFNAAQFRDDAEIGLGDAYLMMGDLQKAEGFYRALLTRSPNTMLKPQIYQRLSSLSFSKGDSLQGEEYLTKLKKEFPLNLEKIEEVCLVEKTTKSGHYFVQVGSFAEPSNANKLTKKLLNSGYPAYVDEASSVNSKVFRVKVGKLSSPQEAEELRKKLAQEGYPTKICP